MDDRRIADWIALTELKARYFRLLDTQRWDEWRQVFTDDVHFYNEVSSSENGMRRIASSGDDLVERVSRALQGAVTVHHGLMPEITFVDDRNATGIWAMFDWVENPGDDGWHDRGYGHYHDRFVKGDDDRWRIAEIRLTRLRLDAQGAAREAPRWPSAPAWTRP